MAIEQSILWGIDLGTTNSELAILIGDQVRVVPNKYHEEFTPSAVHFSKGGDGRLKTEVGKKAKQRMATSSAAHVAVEFKAFMGKPDWKFSVPTFKHSESACTLSSRVLGELRRSLQTQGDLPPLRSAVITVPAIFNNSEKDDTIQAGVKAGIEYIALLQEPVAAALAYGRMADTRHNPIWLAYDLGGGTFDAALVRGEAGVFTVIDHVGNRSLGGKHLDDAILKEIVLPRLPESLRKKLAASDASRRIGGEESRLSAIHAILKRATEEAKCSLSVDDSVGLEAEIDGVDLSSKVVLRRDEIEKLQIKVFGRATLDLCRDLIARNNLSARDIEKVILVGGSTLSPVLRHMIKNGAKDPVTNEPIAGLGIEIDCSANPLTAVAEGAAIYAAGKRIPKDDPWYDAPVTGDGEEAAFELDLKVPARVAEDRVLAAGTLRRSVPGAAAPSGLSVEFERVDSAGTISWHCVPMPVDPKGKFAIRLPLERGTNSFRVRVLDADGSQVKAGSTEFQVVMDDVEVGGLRLARGIGVADENGDTVWCFKKDEAIPTSTSQPFKTTVDLRKGSPGDALVVPIVEGSSDKASLNRVIYTLTIPAKDINVSVPAGSLLTVSLDIDDSERIKVSATLDDYDITLSGQFASLAQKAEADAIRKRLKTIKADIKLFRSVRNESKRVDLLVADIDRSNFVKEVDELLTQGSPSNPEPWDIAGARLLELAIRMDPYYAEVDAMLVWIPHRERCDKNQKMAESILTEYPYLPSAWMTGWRRLCQEYRIACDAHDLERTRELAFELMPEHFKTNDELRERVGGAQDTEVGSKLTSGGERITSTVKGA